MRAKASGSLDFLMGELSFSCAEDRKNLPILSSIYVTPSVAAIIVSTVQSKRGCKPPVPIPKTQSAFHPHARFRTAQSPTALLALARR